MRPCSDEFNFVPDDSVYQDPIVLDVTFTELAPLPLQLVIKKTRIKPPSICQTVHHRIERREILSSPLSPLPVSLKGAG